jgi:hypothetical protein
VFARKRRRIDEMADNDFYSDLGDLLSDGESGTFDDYTSDSARFGGLGADLERKIRDVADGHGNCGDADGFEFLFDSQEPSQRLVSGVQLDDIQD